MSICQFDSFSATSSLGFDTPDCEPEIQDRSPFGANGPFRDSMLWAGEPDETASALGTIAPHAQALCATDVGELTPTTDVELVAAAGGALKLPMGIDRVAEKTVPLSECASGFGLRAALGVAGLVLTPSSLGADETPWVPLAGHPQRGSSTGGLAPGPVFDAKEELPALPFDPRDLRYITPASLQGTPNTQFPADSAPNGLNSIIEGPRLLDPSFGAQMYQSRRFDTPPEFGTASWDKVGIRLGGGGLKDVYEYGDSEAIGIVKVLGYNPSSVRSKVRVVDELHSLDILHEHDVPAVRGRPVMLGEQPKLAAIIYDQRYALGSKDLIIKDRHKGLVYVPSPFLDEEALEGLFNLRAAMKDRSIAVKDFQVLFGKGVDVADPGQVFESWHLRHKTPLWDAANVQMQDRLNRLIDVTRRSIREFPLGP